MTNHHAIRAIRCVAVAKYGLGRVAGIIGLPNVGKSSLINSLKRTRVVNVGNTPGVTTSVQEVCSIWTEAHISRAALGAHTTDQLPATCRTGSRQMACF